MALAPLLAACDEEEGRLAMFDAPTDVVIMEANEISDVPIGFVSNMRSGRIVMVDLKHWSYLRDNPLGSWIRSSPLATGRDRLLEQVAVSAGYAPGEGEAGPQYDITLFASDAARDELLVVPYLDTRTAAAPHCVGYTGAIPHWPICLPEIAGQLSEGQSPRDGVLPVLTPEGAETGSTVTGFWLRPGHTATETWFATWDCQRQHFVVRGSRSGIQEHNARLSEVYFSDHNEIEFLVTVGTGSATCTLEDGSTTSSPLPEGASFTFTTDSGVRAIPMPGHVMDLRVAEDDQLYPGQRTLYASIQTADGRGLLASVDLSELATRPAADIDWQIDEELELCPLGAPALEGESCAVPSRPMAMDLDLDVDHQRLFVAEGSDLGGVYQVDLSSDPPVYTVIDAIGPALDVAYVEDRQATEGYQHLFAADLDYGTVSMYDVAAGRPVDINPFTPEIDPMDMGGPIRGIAAGRVPVPISERTDEQVQKESILLGITTHRGLLYSMKGEDGCLAFATAQGPYLTTAPEAVAAGAPSTAGVLGGLTSYATFHPCGGVTKSELWYFVYSEALQGFRVRGSRTNADGSYQRGIAYENQRYVSDGGEISVFIGSGTLPLSDGDTFTLTVNSNVVPANVEELPSDLALYTQTWGDRNTAWTPASFRTWAFVPAIANDGVYKYDLGIPGNAEDNLLPRLE